MYIEIRKRLFREDPSRRFSRVFKCPPDTWNEVWRRYKILDYTKEETRQYLLAIKNIPINKERFCRWVNRTEVYNKAQVAIQMGAQRVNQDYFGGLTSFVIRELNKNNKHDKS